MTSIDASGVGSAAHRAVGRHGTGQSSSHRDAETSGFAHALLMNAANMTSGANVTVAGGTMRATVEAFGAHGLFDGSTPPSNPSETTDTAKDARQALPPHGGEQRSIIAPASAQTVDLANSGKTAPAIEAIPPSGLRSVTAQPDLPPKTDRPAMADRIAVADPVPVHAINNAGTETDAPAHRVLADEVAVMVGTVLGDERSGYREPAITRGGGSAFTVSLDRDQDGVVVTVAGAVLSHEEDRVRQTVARLMARHGLNISALRLIRQPSVGRQNQESR